MKAMHGAIGLLLVACSGCWGHSGPDLVSVTGTVTLDGKPVKQAKLVFKREAGTTAQAVTQDDGSYQLWSSTRKGAEPGNYTVQISVQKAGDKTRYGLKKELTKEVTSGGETLDFALKSDDFDFTPPKYDPLFGAPR